MKHKGHTVNSAYLLGPANVGKTSLFNLLTGSSHKVANYHGATTRLAQKPFLQNENLNIFDLPGTYSLKGRAKDIQLTAETLKASASGSLWVFVLDAVDLESQLKNVQDFLKDLNEKEHKLLFVVNMMDEAMANSIEIDLKSLEANSGVLFFGLSTKTKEGLGQLCQTLKSFEKVKTQKTKEILKSLDSLDLKKIITGSSRVAFKKTQSIDLYLTAPFLGPAVFILIMTLLFQSVFSWATPFMDVIEFLFLFASEKLAHPIHNIYIKSFLEDALFGGLGSFLVFAPQIFILACVIKILEDSGYLARAAIICHKTFKLFGLSGESFIPLLTSHACAIPGIYASRHISSKRVRFLTLVTLPLTVCSAKLPVYTLLIALLVPQKFYLGGLIGSQGLTLFALYGLGVGLALCASWAIQKFSVSQKQEGVFILELPRYKTPSFLQALKEGLRTTYNFIVDAGPVIFITNCVIWALATFPGGPEHLQESYLSTIGKWLAPLSKPLGLAWTETVALITSFLARETFVSTLSTLYGVGEENVSSLLERLTLGTSHLSLPSVLSLMVFFAIALQCVSTVALLRKELPQKYIGSKLFVSYFTLAYALAFATYQLASALV